MREKQNPIHIDVVHSAHLDLYWIGAQAVCLQKGAEIIDEALQMANDDNTFCFFIETVRFLEYYLSRYPQRKEMLLRLIKNGQIEIGAAYTDRLENYHDGESMLRNAVYGKKILHELLSISTDICYHPDLPGLSEQTPQMYQKAGIRYYLFARGFKNGARFRWKSPDGSWIIAYNFPVHYSYYSIEDSIIPEIEKIREAVNAERPLLACSAGDLGKAGSFISKEDGAFVRKDLRTLLTQINQKYPEYQFRMSGAKQALQAMNEENLPEKFGEAPSRWGQGGEAQRVALFDLDRKTAAILYEAELYTALCYLLGEPVDLKFPQHPLDNRGSSGGKRQYFDLEITPDSTRGWLEYAWRLQMVTQDHNYGGIDGAQSEFDKLLYKKAAFAIAQNAVDQALGRLCREIPGDEKSVVVWNNLNWSRNGSVLLPNGIWESEKPCHAVSSGGEICPVVLGENGLELYPSDIPSVGYETFHIESGAAPVHFFESFYRETESSIELCDSRWRLRFNKRTGVLESVFERTLDQEMVGGTEALAVYCYADYSSGVDERAADRKVLDCSKEHVQSVRLYRAGPVKSCVRIESSICNNKIQIDVILNHQNGEIDVCPRIFWDGAASVQIKLILPLGHQMGTLRYGVAYGEQTYGNYLEDPDFIATDEIDPILYQRYRKVNGWYAYCGKKYGLAVILEHGTMDFCGEETGVTLIRDTRNCGDLDVRTSNEGKHEWRFTVQSYRGRLEDFHPARRAYERLHPLVATQPGGGSQPPRRSFLDTAGAGILTAFMESENGAILRLYNDQTERQKLNLQFDFPVGKVTPVDLLGRPENSQPDILNAFEIKTLSLMKQEKNE